MTNEEIIIKAAIDSGIYTEEQVNAFLEKGYSLPLHTFAEWKKHGFIVKKGQKAKLACQIWNFSKKSVTATDKDGKEEEIDTSIFYLKLAHFFTFEQVEKLATT